MPREFPRRDFLALAALVSSCECPQDDVATPPAAVLNERWVEFDFSPTDHYDQPEHATVLAKREAPLLIALHGAGEVARGLVGGARGWRDHYDLDRIATRLNAPPLTKQDLLGFVTEQRLAQLNGSLEAHPYAGLCVACPYTPSLRSMESTVPFASFLAKDLVPRLEKELALTGKRGIDGVSMGGRIALLVGLSHPQMFASIGALQPAIRKADARWISELALEARAKSPFALRLVTSTGDGFRPAIETLSEQLDKDGIAHELITAPGPHDYVWNRGPGSVEMLLWHERVLRGLPAP